MKTYSVFKQSKDDFRIVASIDYKSYIVRWSVMPPNTDIISFKHSLRHKFASVS